MQTHFLLILICLIEALICDKAGVNQKSLVEAFNTSLPFIKSFHPEPFQLTGSTLRSAKLSYTELTSKNIEFKFDEYGLLHLKFVNLKGQVSGLFSSSTKPIIHVKPTTPVKPIIPVKPTISIKPKIPVKPIITERPLKNLNPVTTNLKKRNCFILPPPYFRLRNTYRADLSNIAWEETYAVESTKKADGKYDVKFKSMTESSISYNIFRVNVYRGTKEDEKMVKIQIKNLNFAPLKTHLKKISGLILETLKNRLK